MCGISGWVSFERDLTREERTAEAMTETMVCRGPDATGVWSHRHAALGQRRLAIIDLPGGTQPMTFDTPDGPVTLVYGGETYNFVELRDELRRRGHVFRTESDTEVVLHGYLEWGTAVAERLNGMYSFAVYDTRTETLLLVRDRMGIKPLYWYATDDGVLFGSEPKAILANPLAERAVTAEGLREVFGWLKTPGAAVWRGMREVRPGTVLTVDRGGHRESTYWRLEATEHTDDLATSIETVRALLDDTVRRQLVSDVPLCVLLSGGLDSSAITALAHRHLQARGGGARSFAVDFRGQTDNFVPDEQRGTPDAPFGRLAAEYVGSRHEEVVIDPVTLASPEVRRATVTARDLPAGLGDMDQSLYLLFKRIREHSTVALAGEAADELFGGYQWFHDPVVQRADTFPWIASPMANRQHNPEPVLDKDFFAELRLWDHARERYREAVSEISGVDGEDAHEAAMRRICYLHLTRFVQIPLDRMERLSMAVGMEVRVPFCDHRLISYVFGMPWSMKAFDGGVKSVLREAVGDLVPQQILDRRKSPYPSTQDPAYTALLQEQAKGVLADGGEELGFFDRSWLESTVLQDPATLPAHSRSGLERLLDLHVWLDVYRPAIVLG